MKKISFNTALLLASALMTVSCNEWLDDVTQTSKVSDEIVWQDKASVDQYVNSFYIYLHKYGQFGETQFNGNLTESLTDVLKYGGTTFGSRVGDANLYVTNADAITPNGGLYSIWANGAAYKDIREVNQFLSLQKKYSNFSDKENARWMAQARFFRAYVYFQLAKRHRGVILYDDLPSPEGRACSSDAETWEFIAKDLDYAIENLPVEWEDAEDEGRVTLGAALALKSRAMLYAERWQDAYDAADSVIKLNRYGLMPDYADAWKGHNKESILEFDYDADLGPNHSFDKWNVPQCDGYEYAQCATPTQEMVECYEYQSGGKVDWTPWHTTTNVTPPYDQLEPRFHATIIYRGCTWKGRVMDCSIDGQNGVYIPYREQANPYGKTTTGYFLRKLLDENLTDVKGKPSSQPWVEIRYAEVLLNKAEAAYRLNKQGETQSLLTELRSRVQLPPVSVSGQELFDLYRNERKVELAYEGHLFWDMRRWRLAHIEYNDYRVHGFKIIGASNTYEWVDCDGVDRKFKEKLYVLPVPTEEIKNNPLVEQYDEWK